MKSMKFVRFMLPLLIVAATISGCVISQQLNPDQIGVISHGGSLDPNCQQPGIINAGGWFDSLSEVNIGAINFDVHDESVATADTQLVGIDASVQVQRNPDCKEIHNMLTNWPNLLDDKNLGDIVQANVQQAIKVGVRGFTLNQLLSDRTGLAISVTTDLQTVATKFSVNVLNVSIKDVSIDPAYQDVLNKKALVQANIDLANRQQDQIKAQAAADQVAQQQAALVAQAQLLAEQAKTAVQVEIASRAGKVIAAQNQVYQDNPAAFELARLDKLQNIVGKGTVWFVPQGTDLSLILNQSGQQVVPVNPNSPTTTTVPTNTNPVTTTVVVTP